LAKIEMTPITKLFLEKIRKGLTHPGAETGVVIKIEFGVAVGETGVV